MNSRKLSGWLITSGTIIVVIPVILAIWFNREKDRPAP